MLTALMEKKMKYSDFNMREHGFAGHMAEPEEGVVQAVIVIMGGEKSLLPGIKIAERFADYGICGYGGKIHWRN